jgi:hypothetical protein
MESVNRLSVTLIICTHRNIVTPMYIFLGQEVLIVKELHKEGTRPRSDQRRVRPSTLIGNPLKLEFLRAREAA